MIHVIVVTHNSSGELPTCLAHLDRQSIPVDSLTVVDSGSSERSYLEQLPRRSRTELILAENIGYGRGNNLGYQAIAPAGGMVVFLNPDTFLPPDYLAQALAVMQENPTAAVISGKLLGFDPATMAPTGTIDSTGIFRSWYGRWYDRGQGEPDRGQYQLNEPVPAVCGALFCCRAKALEQLPGQIFDPDFFLYKEDIELSLRLRAAGWQVIYAPRLVAYHCRGWKKQRREIPYHLRLTAAENELLLYQKHPSPYICWAWLKAFIVRWLRW
jgi:N-acetylglucosaminyl-diphospho-decaprenol L-rhamnosyltransferase